MMQRDEWTTPEVTAVSHVRAAEAEFLTAQFVSSVIDLG